MCFFVNPFRPSYGCNIILEQVECIIPFMNLDRKREKWMFFVAEPPENKERKNNTYVHRHIGI